MALSSATRRLFAAAIEKPAQLIPEKVIGYDLGTYESKYTRKDAQLYAAAVGASADPMNLEDLDYTWEMSSNFKVLPTFGVTIGDLMTPVQKLTECEGMPDFNLMLLLHGEEKLELHKPFPPECEVITNVKVADVADKGKAALITMENTRSDKKTGDKLSTSTSKLFIRGIGGFGYKGNETQALPDIPEQLAKVTVSDKTSANQAIIYRLCSDLNPLHINPDMAALGGFDRPILHGLCSFGYAARVILKEICNHDVNKFKDISARFTGHVFPGETLVTSIWKDGNSIIFAMKTEEREQKVVCMGSATIA